MTITITAVSGSLRAASTTTALLEEVLEGLRQNEGVHTELIELSSLAIDLAAAVTVGERSPALVEALARVAEADLLVVGTPIYRGAYTGLFKLFFDLVGQNDLAGTPVLLTAGGGNDLHSLAIDHSLRPLFAFFDAPTLPIAIYSRSADFADGKVASDTLRAQIARAIAGADAYLKS